MRKHRPAPSLLPILLPILMVAACSGATAADVTAQTSMLSTTTESATTDTVLVTPDGGATVGFGEVITLAVGEHASVAGEDLTFVAVRDERCPEDVACYWEGELGVTYRLGDSFEFETSGFEDGSHGWDPMVRRSSDAGVRTVTTIAFSPQGTPPVVTVRVDEVTP